MVDTAWNRAALRFFQIHCLLPFVNYGRGVVGGVGVEWEVAMSHFM